MRFLFSALFFIFSQQAFSYIGTVQKIKGTKAIVEFERNAKVREGDMVSTDMSSGGNNSSSSSMGKYQNRDYFLTYAIDLVNSSTAAGSVTVTALSTKFGFNFGHFELGPIFSMTSGSTSSSNTSTSTTFGAFGHYNFTANKPNQDWVYYAGGKFTQSSSGSGTTNIAGYGGVSWFPFGNNIAFSAELFGGQSTSNGSSITQMGISSGPLIYF